MNIWIAIGVTALIGIYYVIKFVKVADKIAWVEKNFRRKK